MDLGNTAVKAALVRGAEVEPLWSSPSREPLEDPGGVLPSLPAHVASVVPQLEPALEALLRRITGQPVRFLGRDLSVPLEQDYETPETLGVDRLAGALAASREFSTGCLVVDAGSALTVDWVDSDGRFRGGAIAPGPALLVRTLQERTAALEWGRWDRDPRYPGRSSEDSCILGLTATLRGQILELLAAARQVAGEGAPVILTGGAADTVVHLVPEVRFLRRPHLVFSGIALAAAAAHG